MGIQHHRVVPIRGCLCLSPKRAAPLYDDVTVVNLDLYAYCGRFVLTANSKELFDRAIVI
ncbi:hypothetical protein ALC53_03185 [Atta colombica]|uniref:Uncharacterized protein n=1 Tax=Atta colombica TaxID=520822 RepID=A0A151I5K6_9HYME|nr:hypothetical protein ALC53_03185 [Atta colombica]